MKNQLLKSLPLYFVFALVGMLGLLSCEEEDTIKDAEEDTTIKVSSITISEGDIKVGKSIQLQAEVLPEDASDKSISWSVSDQSMATITESGMLSALKSGNVTVVATAKDGSKIASSKELTISEETTTEEPINEEPQEEPINNSKNGFTFKGDFYPVTQVHFKKFFDTEYLLHFYPSTAVKNPFGFFTGICDYVTIGLDTLENKDISEFPEGEYKSVDSFWSRVVLQGDVSGTSLASPKEKWDTVDGSIETSSMVVSKENNIYEITFSITFSKTINDEIVNEKVEGYYKGKVEFWDATF